MGVIFLATQRISIEVEENPNQSFMAWISYGTPDIAITRIIHLKYYTTFETAKVVGRLPLFRLWLFLFFSLAFLSHNDLYCAQVVAEVCNLIWKWVHFFQRLEVTKTMKA